MPGYKVPSANFRLFCYRAGKILLSIRLSTAARTETTNFYGFPPPVMSQIPDDHCAEDHIKAHSHTHTQPHTHH